MYFRFLTAIVVIIDLQVLSDLCASFFVYFWRNSPQWARASSFTTFLDHIQRRTTVGRTPLDEYVCMYVCMYSNQMHMIHILLNLSYMPWCVTHHLQGEHRNHLLKQQHTETCSRALIKYLFNISCAFGWNTEDVFDSLTFFAVS